MIFAVASTRGQGAGCALFWFACQCCPRHCRCLLTSFVALADVQQLREEMMSFTVLKPNFKSLKWSMQGHHVYQRDIDKTVPRARPSLQKPALPEEAALCLSRRARREPCLVSDMLVTPPVPVHCSMQSNNPDCEQDPICSNQNCKSEREGVTDDEITFSSSQLHAVIDLTIAQALEHVSEDSRVNVSDWSQFLLR